MLRAHSSCHQIACGHVVVQASEAHIAIDAAAAAVVVHDFVGLVANYLPARVMARSCFQQTLRHHATNILVAFVAQVADVDLDNH